MGLFNQLHWFVGGVSHLSNQKRAVGFPLTNIQHWSVTHNTFFLWVSECLDQTSYIYRVHVAVSAPNRDQSMSGDQGLMKLLIV